MARIVKWPVPIEATRGEAASEGVHFAVSGLTCADCAAQFEESVRRLEGIKSAQLNFGAGRLVVRGIFHPREIMRHAKRAGYRATVVDAAGKHPYGSLARDAGPVWFLALAALFFAGGVAVALLGLGWPELIGPYLPPDITLETTLFAVSVFYGGYHTLGRALHGLRHRRLDASFVAVLVAFGAIVIGEWLQAAAAMWLFSLRELILARSFEEARRYVRWAWQCLPDVAVKVEESGQAPAAATVGAQDAAQGAAGGVARGAARGAVQGKAQGNAQGAGKSAAERPAQGTTVDAAPGVASPVGPAPESDDVAASSDVEAAAQETSSGPHTHRVQAYITKPHGAPRSEGSATHDPANHGPATHSGREMPEPAQSGAADSAGSEATASTASAGGRKETPITRLGPGDVCVVGPGQRVPFDGVVVRGGAIVHEPPLSGTEMPVGKREGDVVRAGSRVDEGEVYVRAQRPAAESGLVRTLRLVEAALGTPLLSLRWVSRVAVVLSSVAVAAALVGALGPPLVLGRSIASWLEIGLSLLVLSFPCAFAAAAPAVVVPAVSYAARLGVLVKSGDALERLARVNVVAFEKTGAYTRSRLQVVEIHPLQGWNEREVLALCAGLAWGVDDPVAAALVQAALETEAGVVTPESSQVGKAGLVEGTVGGERYAVGSVDALRGSGVALTPVLAMIASLEKEGKTVALVAHEQEVIAVAALGETVIEESRRALRRLKRMKGINTLVMMTREEGPAAAAAAIELEADEYRAGLRPEEKVNAIKAYQRQGKKVAMVGRYQEDRSALAVADVGVAVGSPGDVDALEKADLLLVGDNFDKLPHARILARRALKLGWQNVLATLLIKVGALVLLGFGYLTLWQAAVADFFTVVIVALGVPRMFRRIRLPTVREAGRRGT